MDPIIVQLLTQLQGAAEKIGIEAARIWPQVVFVTFLQATVGLSLKLICLGVSGVVLLFSTWRFRKAWAARESGCWNEPASFFWWWPMTGALAVFGLCVVVLISTASDDVVGILAPEIATVERLTKQVSGRR